MRWGNRESTVSHLRRNKPRGPVLKNDRAHQKRGFQRQEWGIEMMSGADRAFRVLVVEDELLVAMMIEDCIDDLGHKVAGPVRDVAGALYLLAQAPVDFAILDINLGDNTSFPLADALAQRGIPFIFATAHPSLGPDHRHRNVKILQKPFDCDDLCNEIEAVRRNPIGSRRLSAGICSSNQGETRGSPQCASSSRTTTASTRPDWKS